MSIKRPFMSLSATGYRCCLMTKRKQLLQKMIQALLMFCRNIQISFALYQALWSSEKRTDKNRK